MGIWEVVGGKIKENHPEPIPKTNQINQIRYYKMSFNIVFNRLFNE